MGGKSVALKTIALNVELIRFGFLPFAEKIALKIPDFIEFISGDLQDSHLGLSSFGAEIKALSVLLSKTKGNSGLVLCDELGRSTNPYEGSRFVLALSDWLQSSSSYAIIATHYDGIKTNGAAYYQVAGLRDLFRNNSENNNKKIFDHKELWQLMDYHLIKVSESSEVPKEALNIGILLGLQEEFLERLRKYYG